ncbi:MAG: hypothetical protein ABI165_06380 [Bryobacteraceae bacterium]
MKRLTFLSTIFALLALAALIAAGGMRMVHPKVAQAQSGCAANSLAGPFSYNLSGYYYDNQGNSYGYVDGGILTPDGNGNLSGIDTLSDDGTIAHRTITGTYTITQNCNGNANVHYSDGSTFSLDFFLYNGGKSMNLVDADNNFIANGTATAQ